MGKTSLWAKEIKRPDLPRNRVMGGSFLLTEAEEPVLDRIDVGCVSEVTAHPTRFRRKSLSQDKDCF